ncbi:hypothetical protein MRX96_013199 [Rhipicephalus microplus]
MAYILQGISRVVCHMDDILIWGSNCQEHNEPLRNVLQALAKAGVTLNDSKDVTLHRNKSKQENATNKLRIP